MATASPIRPSWRRTAVQASVLMGLWLMLSGIYDGFHVSLGVISVTVVLILSRRSNTRPTVFVDADQTLHWGRIFLYFPWLVKEMVLSGLHVARVVLMPRMPLNPSLIRFKSAQPNDVARVVLGNSITLTPGTLTVDMGPQEYLVHALTDATAAGLLDGKMQTRVARLFVNETENMVFDIRIVRSMASVARSDLRPGV